MQHRTCPLTRISAYTKRVRSSTGSHVPASAKATAASISAAMSASMRDILLGMNHVDLPRASREARDRLFLAMLRLRPCRGRAERRTSNGREADRSGIRENMACRSPAPPARRAAPPPPRRPRPCRRPLRKNPIALRLEMNVGFRFRRSRARAHRVKIVLADKQHRQLPQRRKIHAFVELAFGDGAFAEKAGRDDVVAAHVVGQRQARPQAAIRRRRWRCRHRSWLPRSNRCMEPPRPRLQPSCLPYISARAVVIGTPRTNAWPCSR